MLGVTLAATGCGSKQKETEAPKTEAATTEAATTEEATTEEATTEAATTEEATTEEATTEAATTEEATTEEATTKAATTEEATTEAETETESETVTEEATTEAETETEEATTEAETETEEATTEAETETEEATTEAETETEEATTEAETETEEATTEAETETEEATTEAETETEEATTEAETETEEATTEAETETETEEATTEAESETESESETEFSTVIPEEVLDFSGLDYVTLGEYKGVEITLMPIEITDEEVQSMIDSETVQTLDEGTVEMGDVANIDYEGTVDGVPFDGGSAQGFDLEIGSGTFIDGFEEGVVGIAVGEEKDLNLTFPENYHSEDLAGKDAVFHVKVNSIQRVPELTDEVAAEVSEGLTADEYVESVRERLAESYAQEQEYYARMDLIETVCSNAVIDGYPTEYLDYCVNIAKASYEELAEMNGLTLQQLVEAQGMTEEDFLSQLEDYQKEALEAELVMRAIAEQEDIELSDEEYAEALTNYTANYSTTEEEVEGMYGKAYFRMNALLDKTLEFLYDNAKFVEETEAETDETETGAETETAKAETETDAETETAKSETQTDAETETAKSETETESETEK